jgi:NTE family protein
MGGSTRDEGAGVADSTDARGTDADSGGAGGTGRAVVCGGGGVTGIAWEIGVLAGLAEHGVHLAEADLIVGTSAGSFVGASLAAGADLGRAYQAQLDGFGTELADRIRTTTLLRYIWAMASTRDPQRYRARIGRLARTASTIGEAERRAVIEARLPVDEWPKRRLLITAVDAESGEFMAFDRHSGVGLVDAVGASCAVPGVWPPVTINGRRWMDGGVRSPANADLASGYDRVVVLAPIVTGGGPVPTVRAQAHTLAQRARVAVISPNTEAVAAIGRNVLDPARRAPAARAGYAQGVAVADQVAGVWASNS